MGPGRRNLEGAFRYGESKRAKNRLSHRCMPFLSAWAIQLYCSTGFK